MICSASLKLALLMTAAVRGDTVPPSFAGRVRAEIAVRWQVDSALLRLQWGAVGRPAAITDSTPFHLSGRGNDGWLVVILTPLKAPPQAIRVRAGVLRNVAVAARSLHIGERLKPEDMAQRPDVVWSPTALDFSGSLAGWEVRREVVAGTVLSNEVVVAPRVIAAGDAVLFIWSNHGVRIEREAAAVSAARLGEVVQGQVGLTRLTGRVIGPGLAQLKETVP
jgi:flagella basal body P-ring formation protein FlgA